MTRGNTAVRQHLRAEIRDVVTRNWLVLGAAIALWIGVGLGTVSALVLASGWGFGAGLFIGLWVAVGVWLTDHFVAWTGFRHRQMGLSAELETGRILDRLGSSWQVEPNVMIDDRYDIDHVVVGPEKVYAVETKWTSTRPEVEGWMSRVARGRAEGLQRALARANADVEVVPVLVIWGRDAATVAPEVAISRRGVRVVAGTEWRHWLPRLDGAASPSDPRPDVLAAICRLRTPDASDRADTGPS